MIKILNLVCIAKTCKFRIYHCDKLAQKEPDGFSEIYQMYVLYSIKCTLKYVLFRNSCQPYPPSPWKYNPWKIDKDSSLVLAVIQSVTKILYGCLRKSVIPTLKINIFKFNHQWNREIHILGDMRLFWDICTDDFVTLFSMHERTSSKHGKYMNIIIFLIRIIVYNTLNYLIFSFVIYQYEKYQNHAFS